MDLKRTVSLGGRLANTRSGLYAQPIEHFEDLVGGGTLVFAQAAHVCYSSL